MLRRHALYPLSYAGTYDDSKDNTRKSLLPPVQCHHIIQRSKQKMLVVNRQHAAVINTPHGSEIRPLIDRTTSDIGLCSLAEEVLPVGSMVGQHHHLETEEIYYILAGVGRMTVGDESRAVEAGDAIFIPRGLTHTLENTGAQPIRLLLVCGPAYSVEDHRAGDAPKEIISPPGG